MVLINIYSTNLNIGYAAVQSTMEWKPKSSQKPAPISLNTTGMTSAPTSSRTDNSSNSSSVDITNLSGKLSQVNILEECHVIIPEHLRVSESERTQLTFGSFGVEFDSTEVSSSVSQALGNADQSNDEPSIRWFPVIPKSKVCMLDVFFCVLQFAITKVGGLQFCVQYNLRTPLDS